MSETVIRPCSSMAMSRAGLNAARPGDRVAGGPRRSVVARVSTREVTT